MVGALSFLSLYICTTKNYVLGEKRVCFVAVCVIIRALRYYNVRDVRIYLYKYNKIIIKKRGKWNFFSYIYSERGNL